MVRVLVAEDFIAESSTLCQSPSDIQRFFIPPLVAVHGHWLAGCPHLTALLECLVLRRMSLPSCVDRLESSVSQYLSAQPPLEQCDELVDNETRDALHARAVVEQQRERDAVVTRLRGVSSESGGCAILQRPGSLRGKRQLIVVVQDVGLVRSSSVGCLVVGKNSSVTCFLHPGSRSKHGCFDKAKLRILFQIEATLLADKGGLVPEPVAAEDVAGATVVVSKLLSGVCQ